VSPEERAAVALDKCDGEINSPMLDRIESIAVIADAIRDAVAAERARVIGHVDHVRETQKEWANNSQFTHTRHSYSWTVTTLDALRPLIDSDDEPPKVTP